MTRVSMLIQKLNHGSSVAKPTAAMMGYGMKSSRFETPGKRLDHMPNRKTKTSSVRKLANKALNQIDMK